MENRQIGDSQITSSSIYTTTFSRTYDAWKGRLNNDMYWSTKLKQPSNPWIQVDLLQQTIITGIITQGGRSILHKDWVTALQIQYGESEDTLENILENGRIKVKSFMFHAHFDPIKDRDVNTRKFVSAISVILQIM